MNFDIIGKCAKSCMKSSITIGACTAASFAVTMIATLTAVHIRDKISESKIKMRPDYLHRCYIEDDFDRININNKLIRRAVEQSISERHLVESWDTQCCDCHVSASVTSSASGTIKTIQEYLHDAVEECSKTWFNDDGKLNDDFRNFLCKNHPKFLLMDLPDILNVYYYEIENAELYKHLEEIDKICLYEEHAKIWRGFDWDDPDKGYFAMSFYEQASWW